MIKTSYIKKITLAAIVVILLLQAIWIFNVYRLMEKELNVQINMVFNVAIKKELNARMASPSIHPADKSDKKIVYDSGIESIGYEIDFEKDISTIMQNHLSNQGRLISINNLDSIFQSETATQNIYGTFIINRLNPATGEVLETTGKSDKLRGAMASQVVPIRLDGSEGVQVQLISPYRSIFRKMVLVLVLSAIILVFVTYVFFFLVNSYIRERRIRRLQTDFSHALIHDMATPLQTIFQINSLMDNDRYVLDPAKRKKGIAIAQQQIVNLQALTDRILTVARAEQSQLVPETELVTVKAMIEELMDKFLVQAKKEITFTTDFELESDTFEADRTMLSNAVSNLIDNAVKYSGESVQIHISCSTQENGLYINVRDNGYGISDKDQRIIFAKFERGPAVKRQEAKGFGLGLAYVKSVAEAHRGTVNLYSKQGEGTVFELFIPYKE